MITNGDIKRFGNDRGYLIVDDDPIELNASSSSSKRGGAPVLIAEENPATLEFFSRLLEDRGFTTLTADSGEAVLRLLSGGKTPDERRKPVGGRTVRLLPRRPTKATLISNLMNPEEPRLIHVGIRPIRAILIGDIMKPPVDGLDLIRRLRPYHIPLVVATSYGADYTLLAKMAGAEIIIHKFADPVYVITTIEEALKRSTHFSPP
jgi:CheY-like chemotaxis protein